MTKNCLVRRAPGLIRQICLLLIIGFVAMVAVAQAEFDPRDAGALIEIAKTGTERTLDDNIISRLWNGDACVDSALDFGPAIAENLSESGNYDGWRIRQLTNYTGGHTAVLAESPNGESYYVDNYFGHVEIQPMTKVNDHTYIMEQVPVLGNTSTGGNLFTVIPWEARDYGMDITVGEGGSGTNPSALTGDSIPEDDADHQVSVFQEVDPNAKFGPQGYGDARYVRGDTPFNYMITFENLAQATAHAQTVTVIDQIPESLDFSSLQLGPISVRDKMITPAVGIASFSGFIDLRPDADIVATVRITTIPEDRLIIWEFSSLDSTTLDTEYCEADNYWCMQPVDESNPDKGMLAPNATSPQGQGYVTFSMNPAKGLENGAVIENAAQIVFGSNDSISTAPWLNTADIIPPSSEVALLDETQNSESFTVQWSGTDNGSGIKSFDIFVSQDNGQTYTQWLNNTTQTTAVFAYGKDKTTYRFYSVATDNVGNKEAAPTAFDTQTQVVLETSCEVQGDLDGDCDVDADDKDILVNAFRTCQGDSGYVSAANYDDRDDCIDFYDYRKWYSLYKQFITGL